MSSVYVWILFPLGLCIGYYNPLISDPLVCIRPLSVSDSLVCIRPLNVSQTPQCLRPLSVSDPLVYQTPYCEAYSHCIFSCLLFIYLFIYYYYYYFIIIIIGISFISLFVSRRDGL